MKQFKLIVSTPQGNMLEKDIFMLSVRGIEGSLAVMANHIPFITTTKEGEVKIYCENGDEIVAEASSGMLTVTKENTTLLCGTFKINE
jgi:F-type H+-transporting ATPase subunit epsilon